jgi:hypothetical protein
LVANHTLSGDLLGELSAFYLSNSSYKMTFGEGNTWGDGIIPIAAAHLQGAENLIIEGVKHSPRTAGIWYGSAEVLDQWTGYLS